MRVLIIGEWRYEIYEEGFSVALKALNYEVLKFSTSNFFKGFFGKIQLIVPFPFLSLIYMNICLYFYILKEKPDLIFLWRPTHILPIVFINFAGIIVTYNNDDPFGPDSHNLAPWHHKFLWFWYKKLIKISNFNFFYRKINCIESYKYGSKVSLLLMPSFLPWRDKPIVLSSIDKMKFECDIVFIGHCEPDGRIDILNRIIDCKYNLKIWGNASQWIKCAGFKNLKYKYPILPANNENYVKALSGSKIALCFLSKLNRDTYTRRCFEIPATGRLLLAERTDDLMMLFKDNEEACFFSNTDELIFKINWLLNNQSVLESISKSGLERVTRDGHDVFNRVLEFTKKINI
jgi:hypothetical protein